MIIVRKAVMLNLSDLSWAPHSGGKGRMQIEIN